MDDTADVGGPLVIDEFAAADVSVVMACYTERRLDDIRAALESLRKQTLEPRTVVVAVDNNASLAERLRGDFDWATVVEHDGGRGASYARNRGVAAVQSEFTAFIDDDEVADPDWLAELMAPFDDQKVIGTGGAYLPDWESGRPTWFPDEFGWVVGGAYTGLPTETAPVRNVWSGNMAVRTAAFRRVGGFRTDFGKKGAASQPEDTDLCIRMAEASGGHWMYVPSAVILHKVPAERASFEFFVKRSLSEGAGKAAMRANLDGSAVDAEYGFVVAAAISAVRRTTQFTFAALLQALAILTGLGAAAVGYGLARVRLAVTKKVPMPSAAEGPSAPPLRPALVVDYDLAEDDSTFVDHLHELDLYEHAWILVRDQARPIDVLTLPADPTVIREELIKYVAPQWHRSSPLVAPPDRDHGGAPITVVICTRERPDDLARALESLKHQTSSGFSILVVDNAPASDATARVVAAAQDHLAHLRYVTEPVPGLSQARNCALQHVDTEYVAWIDDDETADAHWISEIRNGFARHPTADALSGSVVPAELETSAQWWFETYGGHTKGRGFADAVFPGGKAAVQDPLYPLPFFGTGANMAMRTSVLRDIGGFDVGLGAGTPTHGAEDTLMFSQLLLTGSTVVYYPSALTRHYHRRDVEALERQMFGYGVGLTAFYTALIRWNWRLIAPMLALIPRGARDMFGGDDSSVVTAGLPADFPRRLLWIKRRGLASGPPAYLKARRAAARRDAEP